IGSQNVNGAAGLGRLPVAARVTFARGRQAVAVVVGIRRAPGAESGAEQRAADDETAGKITGGRRAAGLHEELGNLTARYVGRVRNCELLADIPSAREAWDFRLIRLISRHQ